MLSLIEICSHFQSSKVINAPLRCRCYRCKTKKQRRQQQQQQQQQLKRDFEMRGVYGIPANWVSERKINQQKINQTWVLSKLNTCELGGEAIMSVQQVQQNG
jgi:hypothetical protein